MKAICVFLAIERMVAALIFLIAGYHSVGAGLLFVAIVWLIVATRCHR